MSLKHLALEALRLLKRPLKLVVICPYLRKNKWGRAHVVRFHTRLYAHRS